MEIDTDNDMALYVNEKFVRAMSGVGNAESGTTLLIPVELETGENLFSVKMISNNGPPRIRMSLTLDRSKDFQSAWNISWGFLDKLICNRSGNSFESPVVKWDSLLNRMTVGIEVCDALTGKTLIKKENVRNGNVIRDNGKVLGEGIYKIIYRSDQPKQETFEEYFLVGSPKNSLSALTGALDALAWSDSEKLNLEAQLKRAEILFRKSNYEPENKEWQEKVLFTLGSLAEYIKLKRKNSENIFKGFPGLQFRGFLSQIDKSKQFYRLFVPSTYKVGEKLPLLLVMPTPIAEGERPFLESPYVANHRKAVQICAFAEKFGFGILWPGYQSAPTGWTYEAVHAEEALEDVENNYTIDSSGISVYGTCRGGFFAGRLVSIYPNRFAAIVYDRAIFNGDVRMLGMPSKSANEWIQAINPSQKIIDNPNIKIYVLHDGSRIEGHGEIQLSKQFLNSALPKRPDIKYTLGQQKIGIGLWNLIFRFLANCKNTHPDHIKVDIPLRSGYAGPISEVFATSFIVVQGTTGLNREGAYFMELAIKNLKKKYQDQFYGAKFILKKDTEITDEDIERYSLVLVGNAASNTAWGRLAAKYPDMTPYNLSDNWSSFSTRKDALAEVFKNPANKSNYVLLIGSNRLSDMVLLENFNPFKAWFDCYVHKSLGRNHRELIFARRP